MRIDTLQIVDNPVTLARIVREPCRHPACRRGAGLPCGPGPVVHRSRALTAGERLEREDPAQDGAAA